MRPPLASFVALRAFEAAARLGSFRDAAIELCVTASAVSHQIKRLEASVGAPLFTRRGRGVALTDLGWTLARDATSAFDDLALSLARARTHGRDAHLKVSALPLFTNAWLMPRLGRFEARHPQISIAIDTANRLADLHAEDVDVAIRNVFAPTAGLAARKLLDLYAIPLCSRELASSLKNPGDLARATLIHVSARKSGWPDWLEAAGVKGLRPKSSLSFDTIPSALAAAIQGRGVLLGLAPLIFDAPGADQLAAPFPEPRISAGAYFLVHRRSDNAREIVRSFVDWLVSEMRADSRRLLKQASLRQISPT